MSTVYSRSFAAVNPLDARKVGSVETAFYRKRSSGLFSRNVTSLAGKLLKAAAPQAIPQATPSRSHDTASELPQNARRFETDRFETDSETDFKTEFLEKTMQQVLLGISPGGNDRGEVFIDFYRSTFFDQAMLFDPLRYIHSAAERFEKFDSHAHGLWKIVMTALALPGGKEWLTAHGARLPQDPRQLEYLVNLARSCVEIEKQKGWFPDVAHVPGPPNPPKLTVGDPEKSTVELAGAASLAGLRGDQKTCDELAWSVNSLRNHLDPTNRPEEFASINNRLLKVGVWARRCSKPGILSRLLPMMKKSPFRALRFGLMGADQTDGNQPRLVAKNAKPQQIRSVLHHLVDRMEGASRIKLFDGGRAGINTKGLGVVLTSLVSGLVFYLKFGFLALRLRTAGIEVAMPPYNLELMIYSSKGRMLQAGMGAAVGPELGIAQATAGAEFNPFIQEQQHSEGIVLRMPRVRGHEEQLRVRFKAMISDLLEWSTQADLRENGATGDLLKKLMGKYQELSVSEIGKYTQKKRGMSVGVEAAVAVNAGPARFSAMADTKLEYTFRMKRIYEDKQGAIHVQKHIHGRQLKVFSGAELGMRTSITTDDARYNAPSLLGWGASVDWLSGAREARREVVYNEGALHSMSFMEVQFQSLKDFRNSVMANLDSWVKARAEQKRIDPAQAERQILDFLRKIETEPGAAKTYAIRAEVKADVVKKINQMNGLIHLLKNRGVNHSPVLLESLETGVEEILNNPDSYQPTSFRVFERHDQSHYRGLHFAVNSHSATGAEGVHAQDRLM